MRNRSLPFSALHVLLFAVCALPSHGAAQTCQVQVSYGMGNNYNGTLTNLHVDSGWQSAVPVALNSVHGGGTPLVGTYSFATFSALADFGRLRLRGSGEGNNYNGNGVSLSLFHISFDTPKARFRDSFLVTSGSLPVGTPVQVRGRVWLNGQANCIGTMPVQTWGAQIRVYDPVAGSGTPVAELQQTTGLATAVVNTTVGATIVFEGRLDANLNEYGVGGTPPATGSYLVDLEAFFQFESLTANAALQSCSGSTYGPAQASAQLVGFGCGTAPPTLTSTLPQLGVPCVLTTTGAPANAATFYGYSLGASIVLPLGGCILRVDPATVVTELAGFASPAGQLQAPLNIPNAINLAGFRLTAQAVPLLVNGPFLGIAELSNAVELRLGF